MLNNTDLWPSPKQKPKLATEEETSKQSNERADLFYMLLSNSGLKVLIKLNHGIKLNIIRTKHKKTFIMVYVWLSIC